MSAKISSSGQRGEAEGYGSELPNGGARVVNVREADDAQQLYEKIRQTREQKHRRLGRPNRIPQQVALNLDEHVPTRMEVEQEDSASPLAPKRKSRNEKVSVQAAAEDDFDLVDAERIEPSLSESELSFDEDEGSGHKAAVAEA